MLFKREVTISRDPLHKYKHCLWHPGVTGIGEVGIKKWHLNVITCTSDWMDT